MVFYVYMLKAEQKKTLTYVGYTNDLSNRLKMHNNGKGAKFTRGRKWQLVYLSRKLLNPLRHPDPSSICAG